MLSTSFNQYTRVKSKFASKGVRRVQISCLWHYIHYLSIPLQRHNWSGLLIGLLSCPYNLLTKIPIAKDSIQSQFIMSFYVNTNMTNLFIVNWFSEIDSRKLILHWCFVTISNFYGPLILRGDVKKVTILAECSTKGKTPPPGGGPPPGLNRVFSLNGALR